MERRAYLTEEQRCVQAAWHRNVWFKGSRMGAGGRGTDWPGWGWEKRALRARQRGYSAGKKNILEGLTRKVGDWHDPGGILEN